MILISNHKIKSGIWAFSSMVIGAFLVSLLFHIGASHKVAAIPQAPEAPLSPTVQAAPQMLEAGAAQSQTPIAVAIAAPKYYFAKVSGEQPSIAADAYVVGDLNTGKIILAKNQNQKFPIASVSKLMTATVATDTWSPSDTVKISQTALNTEGVNGDFYVNQKIKAGDILYPLLLESSNDGAEAIAEHFGRDSFLAQMNSKAEELGLASTSFQDPSGLSRNNISTAFDLFKFAQFLKTAKSDLLKITTNSSYNDKQQIWYSNNQFLHDSSYIGGKSGYTDPALQTVISIFSLSLGDTEMHPIGITLLHTPDRYRDVENILQYLKNNIWYGEAQNANLAWVQQGTIEGKVKTLNSVTLSFLGDMMFDRGVKNSVMKNFGGDFSVLFAKMAILQKSDITFANLDGPASDTGVDSGNLYSFRMSPSVVPALRAGGLSIVSVANNHIGDFGRDAFVDTLARLKENEIQYTGGGLNEQEAEQPTIIEQQGMKIGYLGFSDKGPNSLEAGADTAGILLADNPRYDEIIKNAAQKVDYLVVSIHFGEEYQETHDARQENLAHRAIDDGAKIVVGHNTHVVQDTEVYRNGYIAYSLGNFIFDQLASAKTMQGMLLQIKLNENGQMTAEKDTVKLNQEFQPDTIVPGKPEQVKFQEVKI